MRSDRTSRRIAKNLREVEAAVERYNSSAEAKSLCSRSDAELLAIYKNDMLWLKRPCGEPDIDGGIWARTRAVALALACRGVPVTTP